MMATVKIIKDYDLAFQGEKGLCVYAFKAGDELLTVKQDHADELVAAGAAEHVKTPPKGK